MKYCRYCGKYLDRLREEFNYKICPYCSRLLKILSGVTYK